MFFGFQLLNDLIDPYFNFYLPDQLSKTEPEQGWSRKILYFSFRWTPQSFRVPGVFDFTLVQCKVNCWRTTVIKENQENPSLFAVMKSARTAPDSSPHAFRMIFPSSVGAIVCTDFDEGVCDDVDGDCRGRVFCYPLWSSWWDISMVLNQ
jgi:hypothetical protein